MTRIENTTRTVRENPIHGLLMGAPGGIEASERRGQQQLVNSEFLPTDTGGSDAEFLALGFTFGEPISDDPMFRPATLPDGWKREGSDHAMWSYLVDERGLRRVAIFYKAAFYDRSAAMHLQSVGREVGSHALYGDDAPTRESLRLALLTPDELTALRDELDRMRADAKRHPDIYGKYAARLAACDAILASEA